MVRVGDRYVIERRAIGRVVHAREAAVTRITPRRAYLDDRWFALDDPEREVKPRYGDYITVAVPCAAP